MNSKTDLQRSTELLNIPSSDFVKQAYAMAAELNTSSPEVSAMLRASAARIDVFNALVGTVASANVERYTPDYKMHLNHELAFMRPTPNGSWISLADYLTLLNEKNDLQKQVRALGVELAAVTSGLSYFMHSPDAGFETHKTRDEAINAANEMIDDYRGDAADGWPEEVEQTVWGVIIQQATLCDFKKSSEENGWEGTCDYKLMPETPATDAILNEVRARELDAVAYELAALDTVGSTGAIAHVIRQKAASIRAGEVQP